MSSSRTKSTEVLEALGAAAGVGAAIFPLVAPWHLIFLFAAAAANAFAMRSLILGSLTSVMTVASVLGGFVPSPLATGLLAAASIAKSSPLLAMAILFLQTSIFSTAIQVSAQILNAAGMESLSSALLATIVLGLCRL